MMYIELTELKEISLSIEDTATHMLEAVSNIFGLGE